MGGEERKKQGGSPYPEFVFIFDHAERRVCHQGVRGYSLSADAMPDAVGIPYTLKRDSIPILRIG